MKHHNLKIKIIYKSKFKLGKKDLEKIYILLEKCYFWKTLLIKKK